MLNVMFQHSCLCAAQRVIARAVCVDSTLNSYNWEKNQTKQPSSAILQITKRDHL